MSSNYDYSHINNYDELEKLQSVLLEILNVIDLFCKKHQINYSLCGGSLLGAVRHGGFIPWDDDIDIGMKRKDYDRFIELWQKNPPHGYVLQAKDLNAPEQSVSFLKVRKEHTTFLQFESERGKYHLGIFVDIFPFDRMPDKKILRLVFFLRCLKYQLYIREFIPPNENFIIKSVSRILLVFSSANSRKRKRMKLLNKITKYNDIESFELVAIDTVKSMKILFSPNLLDSLIKVKFEDKEFCCFKNWEEYLVKFFGDYMELPPIEEQNWKHHPIILDFEHDYDGLID